MKDALVIAELQILKKLGFNVHVQLPYGLMVNYLKVLELTEHDTIPQKAWGYLNDAYVFSYFHFTYLLLFYIQPNFMIRVLK